MNRDAPRLTSTSRIQLSDLSRPWQAQDAIDLIVQLVIAGHKRVTLDIRSCRRVYPNAAAPLLTATGLLADKGLELMIDGLNNVNKGLLSVVDGVDAKALHPTAALTNSYQFSTPREVHDLVTRLVAALSRCHECSPGVLLAFEWCLNEIADNVIQHSEAQAGVLSTQFQPEGGRLSICIADAGRGIRNSLSSGASSSFSSDIEAIERALQKGATRDASIHQGNGLWGLREIVKANSGSLGLKSGTGVYLLTDERETTKSGTQHLQGYPGTSVDFQLNLTSDINVTQALDGHQPVNLRLESFESDSGEHVIVLAELDEGTGTRLSGSATRNLIMNLLNEGARRVVLDCRDTHMSSSFIDEVFGMLVSMLGFGVYSERVGVKSLSSDDASIMHGVVGRRLMTDAGGSGGDLPRVREARQP